MSSNSSSSSFSSEYQSYSMIIDSILYNPSIILTGSTLKFINYFGRVFFGVQMLFSICVIWSSRFEFLYMPVFIYSVLLINILGSFTDQLLPAYFNLHQNAIKFRFMILAFRYFFLIVQLFYLYLGSFPASTNSTLEKRLKYLANILVHLLYPLLSFLIIASYTFQQWISIPPIDCFMIILNMVPIIDLLVTCYILRGVFFRRVFYRRVSCQCVAKVDDTQAVVNKIARSTIATSTTIASVNL